MTITFYDIPSTLPGKAWSPNTWKTRYTLNYKSLPYTTQWVEYPDIESICKKLGIKATTKKADGSDLYTLPAIRDSATGVYIADSALIAEYLDAQYPDTPKLFPNNTLALQYAFDEVLDNILAPLWEFIIPATCFALNPPSLEYFRRTREADFGSTMEDLIPKGDYATEQWGKLEESLGKLDGWYAKTSGPFLLGNEISWADVAVTAHLLWLRIVWGKDSQQMKDISSWQGGRWGSLLEEFDKYTTIDS